MSLSNYQSLGLLELLDVELARALGRMASDSSPEVELAVALTSRNVRRGHSCSRLGMSAEEIWPREPTGPGALPDAVKWKEALAQSRLTQGGPLVLDAAGRLYLRRYWRLEQDIAQELAARSALPPIIADDAPWLEPSSTSCFQGRRIHRSAAPPETHFGIESPFFAADRAPARRRRWRRSSR